MKVQALTLSRVWCLAEGPAGSKFGTPVVPVNHGACVNNNPSDTHSPGVEHSKSARIIKVSLRFSTKVLERNVRREDCARGLHGRM